MQECWLHLYLCIRHQQLGAALRTRCSTKQQRNTRWGYAVSYLRESFNYKGRTVENVWSINIFLGKEHIQVITFLQFRHFIYLDNRLYTLC